MSRYHARNKNNFEPVWEQLLKKHLKRTPKRRAEVIKDFCRGEWRSLRQIQEQIHYGRTTTENVVQRLVDAGHLKRRRLTKLRKWLIRTV